VTNPRADAVRGGSDNVDAGQARRSDATATPSVPAQLRRRRIASWRLPPLPSGQRDPLDPVGEPITDTELVSSPLRRLNRSLQLTTGDIELPVPEVPVAELNGPVHGVPLLDSRWPVAQQWRRLIDSKAYRTEEPSS
jgi:hypothetical protein